MADALPDGVGLGVAVAETMSTGVGDGVTAQSPCTVVFKIAYTAVPEQPRSEKTAESVGPTSQSEARGKSSRVISRPDTKYEIFTPSCGTQEPTSMPPDVRVQAPSQSAEA